MNQIQQIKALKEKQEKIKSVLHKAKAQKEVAIEERAKIVNQLQEEFGIEPDEIDRVLTEMKEEQESSIALIKEKLDKINL